MAKVRVYELAKELGVDSRRIMARLAAMGEFVRSASSTVEPVVVERLKADLKGLRPERAAAAPPWQSVRDTDARAAAAAFAEVDPSEIRLRRAYQPRTQGATPLGPKPPLESSSQQFAERQARRDSKRLARTVVRWATNRLMEPSEVRGWLAAGLGEYDDAIAEQCQMEGLTPADLAVRVDGLTAGARMRGGEPVASVVARMRELGLLAS